jgi:hypothetical protein
MTVAAEVLFAGTSALSPKRFAVGLNFFPLLNKMMSGEMR